MPPIYVVLVDNDPIYLGLATRFLGKQENLIVSGVIAGSNELFNLVQVFEPDILLYNLSSSRNYDLDAISRLKEISPGTHIIAVASHGSNQNRKQVLLAGADNFVKRTRVNIEFLPMVWKLITMYRHRNQRWEMEAAPLTPIQRNFDNQTDKRIH